ncbi:response regulator [Magnetospirillum sulfuroxidans]|uniref:Response regulator n=1 Tax=Magnetospirillum sulfuroxidans TaxID=611300 RepID=A0ABS5IBC0_9PROT|nr:response regulator [Magnetospirillum sulfuroxidans]MBR9971685.1 response regulator [Magnetospirillum sulfuroxidans]
MSAFDSGDNENERRVISEFLEELRDTASSLQVLVGNMRSHSVSAEDGLATLKREASNLRSHAQALNVPLIKLVTHRLDEYVGELKVAESAQLDEIQVFVDRIEKLADGEQVTDSDVPSVMRSLPAKRAADVDFGPIEQKNVEVLMVVPEKAMARIVERELAACGYRTSVVRNPFEALENVVHTRPDMVIASMELGILTGVDLGCALAAMPVTQGIPFAVLTSYSWGHPKLAGLPPRAALIRKGAQFGDDLAESLSRFNIT